LERINVNRFIDLSATLPVIDVRSPSEYAAGHIPGAINIPLFSDEERAIVGTIYKKEGRLKAVLKGFDLIAPLLTTKLKNLIDQTNGSKLLVHCWRGGQRSESMAWLFSMADYQCSLLEGGYKAYRSHILDSLSQKRRTIILGGLTGSSKTMILRHIAQTGRQVIDLEAIACHKGSAFGALGEKPQPTTEHFANLLYDQWRKTDPSEPLWLEDESRNIGSVFMPDPFYRNMQESPALILLVPLKCRMPRLIREYSNFNPEELKDSVRKISKRLGGSRAMEAIEAIDKKDFERAIEITLDYYDKTYMYGISKKDPGRVIIVRSDTDDIAENAARIIEASEKIVWEN